MGRIEDTDKNFRAAIPVFEGMRSYNIHEEPFKIYGLKYSDKGFFRMDTVVADKVSDGVRVLNYHTSGGILRFRTDSERIILTAELPETGLMNHMPLTGTSSFSLYADKSYCGIFRAPSIEEYKGVWSSQLPLPAGEKDIEIHFPLYNSVKNVCISLEENAAIKAGREYESRLPVVFYGSSITQGGCASHPGNSYTNMISRHLNREIINLGFSGSCLAEKEMCDYIKKIPMSLLVYDYDHNAPTPEFLESTHEKFFRDFRKENPAVPVLMISVADAIFSKDNIEKRKQIIRKTYENAKNAGDENVYFLDGQHFYDETGLENSTVDTCHPNDLGFYAFYKNISTFIKENNL